MATRFYLPSSLTPVVTPAYASEWELTAHADRLALRTTKQNTGYATRSALLGTNGQDSLVAQYVSEPLAAGAISGTVKGILQAWETSAGANARAQIVIRVVSNNGATVRGTLLAADPALLASEFPWAGDPPANRKFPLAWVAPGATLSSVTAQADDRIVIEIGARSHKTLQGIGTLNASLKFGDPTAGSDLAENETDTAAGVPWIEFSQTLSFTAETAYAVPATYGNGTWKPRKRIRWRLMLTDLYGNRIADLSTIAKEKKLSYALNRPTVISGVVPADHRKVNATWSDGYPYLEPNLRAIKAYREENGAFVLRAACRLASVEDIGDEQAVKSVFVALDPFHFLAKRLVRNGSTFVADPQRPMSFTNTPGSVIARQIVERTNQYAGTTLVQTQGGRFDVTEARDVRYELKSVAAAIAELAESVNGFDVVFDPVDHVGSIAGDFGVLVQMSVWANRGVDRPGVIFSYDAPGATCSRASRKLDTDAQANIIYGLGGSMSGGSALVSARERQPNRGPWGVLEDLSTYSEITHLSVLNALVDEELTYRGGPKTMVTFQPIAGKAAEPFSHFFLGDTVRVRAGASLRGGFSGVQRIRGFDLDLSDEGFETMSAVHTTAT